MPKMPKGRPAGTGTALEFEQLGKLFNSEYTVPCLAAQRLAGKFRLPITVARVIAELAFGRAAQ